MRRATIPTYRAATFAAARAFGLFDRGQIAPGRRANRAAGRPRELRRRAGDLRRRADRGGRVRGPHEVPPVGYGSVKRAPVGPEIFVAPPRGRRAGDRRDPESLLTDHLTMSLPWQGGSGCPIRTRACTSWPCWNATASTAMSGSASCTASERCAAPRQQHRPRQPQHHRGRRRRLRHGARGEPADRAAGRRRRGGGRRGAGRAALPVAGLMSDRPSRRSTASCAGCARRPAAWAARCPSRCCNWLSCRCR